MSVWDNFVEIDISNLMPGETLKASTLYQINENTKQAVLTPEFFGPTDYSNGDTVSLPTSSVDGYSYSRSELFYMWEWRSQDADSTGQHYRLPGFYATINQTTGAVTIEVWRLKPGGPYVTEPDAGDAVLKIRVWTVGMRKLVAPSATTAVPVPPPDAGDQTADDDGTNDTIEGS